MIIFQYSDRMIFIFTFPFTCQVNLQRTRICTQRRRGKKVFEVPLVPLSNLTIRFSLTCVQSARLPVLSYVSICTRRVSFVSCVAFFFLHSSFASLVSSLSPVLTLSGFFSLSFFRLLWHSQSTLPCNELHFCLFSLSSLVLSLSLSYLCRVVSWLFHWTLYLYSWTQ